MTTFRYSISNGLAGCYMPDNVSGPYTGTTRRELARMIRDAVEMMDWPASVANSIKLRPLWSFIKARGSSCAHFSIARDGYELTFHGLTEEEANEMDRDND
jgi:hypothetical protein